MVRLSWTSFYGELNEGILFAGPKFVQGSTKAHSLHGNFKYKYSLIFFSISNIKFSFKNIKFCCSCFCWNFYFIYKKWPIFNWLIMVYIFLPQEKKWRTCTLMSCIPDTRSLAFQGHLLSPPTRHVTKNVVYVILSFFEDNRSDQNR